MSDKYMTVGSYDALRQAGGATQEDAKKKVENPLRYDPRQLSLYGAEHTQELVKIGKSKQK